MHSTTNNPNLRKNFVGNLLKNYIHDTILEADGTKVWDELHPWPPPPQTISTTPHYLHTVVMWCTPEEGPESPDSFTLLCSFTISLEQNFLQR